ncbi:MULTISPECIES: D-amino acid aminotransferase [unclassified Thioalkalivibrio]|uniref:D-amino acid aminotransferase n=1 Tax=unclassified Thioalkalivibrio TaxID=2621013 RepID=UPI00037F4B56|nr:MULTISPECIES: D-amino acid aminotransferase [unclassified Thioalkalivibrio]
MSIAYFNGDYLPLDQVRISPLDRGFLFGDSVYEVIPSYAGEFFMLPAHLERLDRSLAAIRISNPFDEGQWTALLEDLLARNADPATPDLGVYLQVTRGVAPRDHAFPLDARPTVLAMVSPIRPLPETVRTEGVAAVTAEDRRWGHCDIKATTLLANVLNRQAAVEQGAVEAILLRDGQLTEGAASNVLVVLDGRLVTPPLAPSVLPGVTRSRVLDLARELGYPVEECAVSESELARAEEIWLTSSTREILPVTRLNDRVVGTGHPGPVWKALHAAYQAAKPGALVSEPMQSGGAA